MFPEGLDQINISKLISEQVEQVTCTECCKYYLAPKTAKCGHTLCHGCWSGRRSCPTCAVSLDRRALRLNRPKQTLTEHIHALVETFEKLFNVKLEEFVLDFEDNMQSSKDPTKNVKDWLASSQNHFSAPVLSSQLSTQMSANPLELCSSKIQIHTPAKKTESPQKVIHVQHPQVDWDKIEILPDTESIWPKEKENVVGPMDIEPFVINENEYSTGNPRRSSRKRGLTNNVNTEACDISTDKHSGKNSSTETDKKSLKTKQNWSSVKKMRKEFSKLNKQNRSKLNVSIEMCKKAQSSVSKPKVCTPPADSQPACLVIDDNTPNITNDGKKIFVAHSAKNDSENLISDLNDIEKKETNVPNKETSCQSTIHLQNKGDSNEKELDRGSDNPEEIVDEHDKSARSDTKAKTPYMQFIKKGALHQQTTNDNCVKIIQNKIDTDAGNNDNDDIEISIKIGNTITNICIRKQQSDLQLKVNTDREIQTTLGPYCLKNKTDASCSPFKGINMQNIEPNIGEGHKITKILPEDKSTTKKNTASADTASAHFEITESVEKELSNEMECIDANNSKSQCVKKVPQPSKTPEIDKQDKKANDNERVNDIPEDIEYLNDLDIFGSGSIKEPDVQSLRNAKHTPSEILMPTVKSKKSQRLTDKRYRENTESGMPSVKKQKYNSNKPHQENLKLPLQKENKNVENDSENMNYDTIMGQVFASIDAEIEETKSHNSYKATQNTYQVNKNIDNLEKQCQPSQIIHKTQNISMHKNILPITTETGKVSNLKECTNQKDSENIFSLLEKDSDSRKNVSGRNNNQLPDPKTTQQHIENLLTPEICRDLANTREDHSQVENVDVEMMEQVLGTPLMDHDHDDESVVEETPQKNLSFSKLKQKSDGSSKSGSKANQQQPQHFDSCDENKKAELINKSTDSQIIKSIINISDTSGEISKVKDTTIVEIDKNNQPMETPLTLNKFFNQIKHNSTPVARKSLNFESEDSEQTLCPTTTQEKEFLAKAFEQTPNSPIKRPLSLKNIKNKEMKKYCVAGSCLTPSETANVKKLCHDRGWTYVNKYTEDLTHLVVGVDEENKSQRSVKYMCALAASKWIISYTWVEQCLMSKDVVDELPYEALDACGDPGPQRSRRARRKLFEGFTFHCMPPFSVLDLETLKLMLVAAGGRVVDDAQGVKVTADGAPALLLAEPEHTQEDRFIYLAMELGIVPVNYEWVLNCLGSYSLGTVHDLLLCPSTLLPAATDRWPAALMLRDSNEY